MFLVRDKHNTRRPKILSFVNETDAPIAVLLAAANFEFTVGRAIMALGNTPNKPLRERLERCSGLHKYKMLWNAEAVKGRTIGRLEDVVANWSDFEDAYELRHILIHGRRSCTKDYAEPRVIRILDAASNVFDACTNQGISLDDKLKVRLLPRIR